MHILLRWTVDDHEVKSFICTLTNLSRDSQWSPTASAGKSEMQDTQTNRSLPWCLTHRMSEFVTCGSSPVQKWLGPSVNSRRMHRKFNPPCEIWRQFLTASGFYSCHGYNTSIANCIWDWHFDKTNKQRRLVQDCENSDNYCDLVTQHISCSADFILL